MVATTSREYYIYIHILLPYTHDDDNPTDEFRQILWVIPLMEILHIKPCKCWDRLPINWCRISAINSSRDSKVPRIVEIQNVSKAYSFFEKFFI